MLQLAVELVRIRSFFGDAPYSDCLPSCHPQVLGTAPYVTMTRVSLRQRANRRATRRACFLTHVVLLEVSALCDVEGIESGDEYDVPDSLLWLLLSRRKLRALVANRYLHMGRDLAPKTAEWGNYVLDALPEHRWRGLVRIDRSTYTLLTDLLSEHLPESRVPLDRPISTDRVQNIALFRLGLDGNSASTLIFFLLYNCGHVRVAGRDVWICAKTDAMLCLFPILMRILCPQVSTPLRTSSR